MLGANDFLGDFDTKRLALNELGVKIMVNQFIEWFQIVDYKTLNILFEGSVTNVKKEDINKLLEDEPLKIYG